MDLGLSGRIALVTGASSGIGAAAAALFAQEGADVVIAYGKDGDGAARAAEAVRAHGRRAWLCSMDVASFPSVAEAAQRITAEVAGLDALVLCAGHNLITPFAQVTAEEWERVVGVNLNGAFYVLQVLTPLLRDGAAVVTVASVAAVTGAPHHAHYAAAKAGLVNLTKSAARALAPRVRVNCVSPGLTLTPMGRDTIESLAPDYAQNQILLRRYAQPEEIARCIVFAASPAASFMTGATLDVNGGRDLR
jgi:3-oxoacyl-[acyl-carrier protein] reductase